MNLRLATSADIEAIAELHTASWRSTYGSALSSTYLEKTAPIERMAVWTQRLSSPKTSQYVVVAERDAIVAGFACVYVAERADWGSFLDNLHVSAPHQGRGLGKAMIANVAQRCERLAPGRGLYLSVNQTNHRAQQIYLHLGARNAEAGTWNAPDGSLVPTYWFVWDSVESLARSQC